MSNERDPAAEPEYLGTASPAGAPPRRRAGRTATLGLAAGAVIGAAAAGGWAALALMAGAAQPAEAVPADALAYVSIDLDPAASQKVEALQIAGKFPAVEDTLGLDAGDDLRRWLFTRTGLADCAGVDYETDVAPWIGERAALAVLPGEAKPRTVVALAVTDEEQAAEARDRLMACDLGADREPPGFALGAGHVVLAENQATAQSALEAATASSLADDPTFERWTEAAGDPGIITGYLSPEAPARLAALGQPVRAHEPWSSFDGLGAVVRFEDGSIEMEVAAGGLPRGLAATEGTTSGAGELPPTTGAALSVGFPEGWVEACLDTAEMSGLPAERLLAEAEARTGLSLPEDLETLLGESSSVVVDSRLDVAPRLPAAGPTSVSAGVRVVGDTDEILHVVDKIKAALGPMASMLAVESGQGSVAFGFDPEYVAELAGSGLLGADPVFASVVPDPDRATAVAFVNFDAGDHWATRLADDLSLLIEGRKDPRLRENLEPLGALGLTTWADGDVQRGLLRLTTD